MRILVSRTDRIGDVVLTLPLCGLLQTQLRATVLALGRAYTRPVLEASPFVDEVLNWDAVAERTPAEQADWIAATRADVVLHAFPSAAIARAARTAGIPVRIGTSHRVFHWWTCNRLEHFTRRRSHLHEAQLNLRLARSLLSQSRLPLDDLVPFARLEPRVDMPEVARQALRPDGQFVLAMHPRSGGSAQEWPLERFQELCASLPRDRFRVIVTGSPQDRPALSGWLRDAPPHVQDLIGRLSLAELIAVLARVDGFVASSTGPLHLAAALGTPTLGLFPPTAPLYATRWAPLGRRAQVLVGTSIPPAGRKTRGMRPLLDVPVSAVRRVVMDWAGATP